jgi:hypothetical protein
MNGTWTLATSFHFKWINYIITIFTVFAKKSFGQAQLPKIEIQHKRFSNIHLYNYSPLFQKRKRQPQLHASFNFIPDRMKRDPVNCSPLFQVVREINRF